MSIKYSDYKTLMHDSFIDLYKNKEQFFTYKFVIHMNKIIDSYEELLSPTDFILFKKLVSEEMWSEWENYFHNNRLDLADELTKNAKKICPAEDWEKLFMEKECLDWFTKDYYVDDDTLELNCAEYDEPINYDSIYNLLTQEDVKQFNLPSPDELNLLINGLEFYDHRFFLASEKYYEEDKIKFNSDLLKICEYVCKNQLLYDVKLTNSQKVSASELLDEIEPKIETLNQDSENKQCKK